MEVLRCFGFIEPMEAGIETLLVDYFSLNKYTHSQAEQG